VSRSTENMGSMKYGRESVEENIWLGKIHTNQRVDETVQRTRCCLRAITMFRTYGNIARRKKCKENV
jgi:hypothetical protein